MATAVAVRTIGGLTVPEAGTYVIDPAHSAVEFVVRHLGLAKVRGRFTEFQGVIEIGEDPFESSTRVTIDASSIDTGNADRDAHLRSADFLDVEHHPTIDFRSRQLTRDKDDWLLEGELTIRGTTRAVTLEVVFEGGTTDPWDNVRIAFSAETEVNREDWGLTWNQALEAGGWLVGKQVKIELAAEAVRQQ
ncbi:MAG TPA: YceI family protein [Acidimicrobiales bacterium]|nr:YceI family protein [Acidimicrobiales bacterium]